jgi:hypothetical protein
LKNKFKKFFFLIYNIKIFVFFYKFLILVKNEKLPEYEKKIGEEDFKYLKSIKMVFY